MLLSVAQKVTMDADGIEKARVGGRRFRKRRRRIKRD